MPTQTQLAVTNVILYARSARNDNDGAVEQQLIAGRAWTKTQGGTVLDTYHEFGSANGPCPELQRAIQAAQAQGAALVCARQDRMARDIALYLARLNDCRQRGVPVYFADQRQPQDEAKRTLIMMEYLYQECWQHEARAKQAWRQKQRPANPCPKKGRTPPPQSPDAEAQ